MRTLLVVLAAFSLILSGCFKEPIVGSGDTITETRRLSGSFNEIFVKAGIDVQIKQGDSIKVEVKDYENAILYLTTRISGNRLVLDYEDAWMINSKGEVTVTMPRLTGIEISGSSDVGTIGSFRCEDLLIDISGSGNVNLVGSAQKLNLKVSGSGDFRAFDMPSDTARISISGSGSGQLSVNKLLDVKISGSGDVIYKGTPSVLSNISGSGRVRKF